MRGKRVLRLGLVGGLAATMAAATIPAFATAQISQLAGATRSYLLTLNAPAGTMATEANAAFRTTGAAALGT